MIVINDLHLGVQRMAGATPESAKALTDWIHQQFSNILGKINEDLVIAGDMFDTYQVPLKTVLYSYQQLSLWLEKGYKLFLVCGNHDLSTDSSKMSSFQFLGQLLSEQQNVTFVQGSERIYEDVYVISHIPNQDLFDMELARVPKCKYLIVHCNYDNNFAAQSDHSLNLTQEVAENLPVDYIFFAHEHYYREELKGKVFISGNQFPTSISDCLHREDKFMTRLGDKPHRIQTWDASNYVELDWRNHVPTEAQFVRFVGHCKPEEAADMADVVARYRKSSDAFVVSNAVRVGEDSEGEQVKLDSLEAITKFNVMEALKDYLTKEEVQILEKLDA